MEVAATCFNWPQPVAGHTPAPAQTFSSLLPSLGRSRRAVVLLRRSDHRSALFGRTLDSGLCRGGPPTPARRIVERAAGGGAASLDDGFDDDEFAPTLNELARSFEVSDDDDAGAVEQGSNRARGGAGSPPSPAASESLRPFEVLGEPPWEVASPVPPEWPHPGAIIPASVERKANSVELPLSLRMIKRKKQWQEGLMFSGESAYCSVKKAFSSMVFIIRELQSYTLQLRELLFYQDLQGILIRVQTELNASFVWLFQQIFSQTPTLMVYVMILLANFTVYSIGNNAAALAASPYAITTTTETVSSLIEEDRREPRPFDQASVVRTYPISGRSVSVRGGGGDSGRARPVAGSTDGGERRRLRRAVVPSPSEEETAAVPESEETRVWNAMVEEAMRLQPHINDGVLDQETMQRFVSPVTVQIPPDDYADYLLTELSYQLAVAQEPNNPLLLSNYAQFLFLVVHDHDRYHHLSPIPNPSNLFCFSHQI